MLIGKKMEPSWRAALSSAVRAKATLSPVVSCTVRVDSPGLILYSFTFSF